VRQSESAPTDRTPGPVSANDEETRQALLTQISRSQSRMALLASSAPGNATPQTLLAARRATLRALENYSAALSVHGWPTPRRMVRDIQLLRRLCGITRPSLHR